VTAANLADVPLAAASCDCVVICARAPFLQLLRCSRAAQALR
jgi:hypothetical protein